MKVQEQLNAPECVAKENNFLIFKKELAMSEL